MDAREARTAAEQVPPVAGRWPDRPHRAWHHRGKARDLGVLTRVHQHQPAVTSVLAGGVFVLGLIGGRDPRRLQGGGAGPRRDHGRLTNIHDDGAAFKQAYPDLDLDRLEDNLVRIVTAFHDDLGDPRSTGALAAIDELNATFLEMDRIGVPATYNLPAPR